MAPAFSWLVATGSVAVAAALAAAWLVYSTRPDRVQNRRLAAFLLVYASNIALQRVVRLMATSLAWADASVIAGLVPTYLSVWFYLRFIATLRTPLVRPLRRRGIDALLGVAAVGLSVHAVVWPRRVISGYVPFPHLDTWSAVPSNIWFNPFWYMVLAFTFGLVAGIDQWRRMPRRTLRRVQARWYLTAFGTNEGIMVGAILSIMLWPGYAWYDATQLGNYLTFIVEQASLLLFSMLLSYAILKHQLFDIDLRIKVGISRTTVLAGVAAVVFVVSEAIEQWLGVDQFVPAIAAAAIISLVLRPLLRWGEWIADRLLPHIRDTPDYRARRSQDIYQAAVEAAWTDSEVTVREQAVLETLRVQLGLDPRQARRIERAAATQA